MPNPVYDCLCAGIVVADHVCHPVDHMPAPGELVLTDHMDLAVGGCEANVAVDMAKLGAQVAVVGRVGDDVFGRFVRDELQSAGVDCGHLAESSESGTSGTFVINSRGEDRRFIHTVGANAEFSGREVTEELLGKARSIYLGGYCLSDALSAENVAALFQEARRLGATTVLDVVIPEPADYWLRLRPVLPHTDVFLPNNDEGRLITGIDDPLQQALEFQRAGAQTVVVTCGDDGAVLVNDQNRLRSGKYSVDFVDGTGSGDAFAAGFLYGVLAAADVKECLRYGSALGASCVLAAGATKGVFTADEMRQFTEERHLSITKL